ncbi:MAG TPA: O-antigen polysaccharide polymerase Wzy [Candidatus Sulfotelmatobacter sp.]
MMSLYDANSAQVIAAFILCWIPWAGYREWTRGSRDRIPLFVLLGFMYWIGYAVPLFWTKHEIHQADGGGHPLSESAITQSLYLVVLGVAALGIGMTLGGRLRLLESIKLDIHQSPKKWHYLRFVLLAAVLLKIAVPISTLGGGGRQFLTIIETVVPSVAFAILLRYYLRGTAIPIDKCLLAGYAGISLIAGISSGWLGSFVGVAIIATGVYVYEKGKFPVVMIALAIPIVLFLQPGKERFRQQYWRSGASESYVERLSFWVESSWASWGEALSNSDRKQARDLANQTLGRLSLLQQTANVMESTPDRVPYQNGRLYSYMFVTIVPRLFWPDKPSVNGANRWYQVAYGLTTRDDLNGVSIAVGYLTESYINFGWLGPPVILFCLGILLGLFDKIFLRPHSGLLLNSIGMALLPHVLPVEAQLAQYLGGVGQQVVVALITMAPMFDLHPNRGGRLFFPIGASYKVAGPMSSVSRTQAEPLRRF